MQETHPDVTSCADSVWIYVKRSKVHGMGVFALNDIPKGTRIIRYAGEKLTKGQGDKRMQRDIKNNEYYVFELDEHYDIDGLVGGNDARFINHSCEPNCIVEKKDEIWIVAAEDIKAGTELSYDYKFDLDELTFKCLCRCGSLKCRGFIVDAKFADELKMMSDKRNVCYDSVS